MDYQVLFNGAVALAAFFGGWVLNNITRTLERLDLDVRNLPHDYVAKEDFRLDMRELKELLTKISDKLDNKQDK